MALIVGPHTEIKSMACDRCGSQFRGFSAPFLRCSDCSRLALSYGGGKSFVCSVCDRLTPLRIHARAIASTVRPWCSCAQHHEVRNRSPPASMEAVLNDIRQDGCNDCRWLLGFHHNNCYRPCEQCRPILEGTENALRPTSSRADKEIEMLVRGLDVRTVEFHNRIMQDFQAMQKQLSSFELGFKHYVAAEDKRRLEEEVAKIVADVPLPTTNRPAPGPTAPEVLPPGPVPAPAACIARPSRPGPAEVLPISG